MSSTYSNYVAYHTHTYYSLLDSCTSPEDYIKRAAECGMNAFCFSEHGNIFNWFKKKQLCEQYGLKYLHGIEVYVTETHDEKIKDNWHTVLIAKNYEGFKEINNLFYKSYQPDHTYYKHRISVDEFLNISDNVIKISACIQSPIWQFRKSILNDTESSPEELQQRKNKYYKMLKHYDYYEIQYHTFADNLEYTKFLWDLSKKFHKPLIVGTDTHSLDSYKAECRIILQYGKTENEWGNSENECDLTFKTYDELVQMFVKQQVLPLDVILEAINNTNVMADSCNVLTLDTHDKYPYLYGEDDEKVMWNTIKRNYKDKLKRGIISNDKAYVDQIKEEMAVFKKVNMVGFMLFMSEMMTWARNNHIATGFSRGSVSGSMVAFITNITDVDPIKWGTIFSRFCNEHRVEAGDIDTDWYEDDRPKIYDYIISRFGQDKTGYILALGTMAEKNTIATICRALCIKNKNDKYNLKMMKQIKYEYDENPEETKVKYPEVFYYFDGLVDCVASQSQHPAGIVASPINLTDFCGAFIGTDGQKILPLDMDCCHDIGLIKYDILGLKTVGVIDKTCHMIGQYFPKAEEIDFNDQAVYDDMNKNPLTIFQFESPYASDCFVRMGCHSIDDISIATAAIRPGSASYRDSIFAREEYDNGSEIINELLKNTYHRLLFQEQVTAFLQYICGFSGSDADSIRRAIGKKDADKIAKAMPQILEGYCSKSDKPRKIAEEEAKKFLKVIEDASSYMFNYNHALGYSLLSYLCGYYRHYYPAEYCTAYLSCANNDDDLEAGTTLAMQLGLEVVNVKFRHAEWDYSCDAQQKKIYRGLSSIPFMSKATVQDMSEVYNDNFEDFVDVIIRLTEKKVNTRQLEVLIKMDFFSEFGDINYLLKVLGHYKKFKNRKKCIELTKEAASNETKLSKTSFFDIIKYEFEVTKMISTIFPTIGNEYYFVTKIKGNQFTMYQLKTGQSYKFKIKLGLLRDTPVVEGNLVKILEVKSEGKWYKDANDKWRQRNDLFEDVIKRYIIVQQNKN